MKRYKITDICELDAYYQQRSHYIGKTFFACPEDLIPSPIPGWECGTVTLPDESKPGFFLAFRYEELSEAEKENTHAK